MRRVGWIVAVLLICSGAATAPPTDRATVVRVGRLVDGRGGVLPNASIVLRHGKIEDVLTGRKGVPEDAEIIDLGSLTAVPGLIDVHTHMTYYFDEAAGGNPFAQPFGLHPAVSVFLAQENARKTLEAGVTTVRDLGALYYCDMAMRDLINRRAMTGPRMLVSGPPLRSTSWRNRPEETYILEGIVDGVTEVSRAVRTAIAAGVDHIKIIASTGSASDVTGQQTLTFEEMKAAIEIAHMRGKMVAVHSYGPDGARDAVKAGADSIEHATDIDDETLVEMAARGVFYVPTVDHNRYYVDARGIYGYGEDATAGLDAYRARNLETLRRAIKAGVRIGMGSDAVFTMFGQNTRELAWFVEAGMAPADALATATSEAAELLGMKDTLGAIAPGYHADIVAVDGDPLKDIQVVIENVKWVMKGGEVVVDRR